MSVLRYALAAAGRGWHVFPLAPGGKVPPRGFTSWESRATTDTNTIRAWWAHTPTANVGIATGPSNLVVIDLDTPKDGQEPPPEWDRPGITDGADVLAALCEQAGQPLPLETFQVRTRRGGIHLYYTAPEGLSLGNTQGCDGGLGWLIDTRGKSGIIVGPGSYVADRHGRGSYTVIHAAPAAPLPEWLVVRLTPKPLPPQRPVTVTLSADRRGAYLRAAITRQVDYVLNSPGGGHNKALYWSAAALGQLVAGGELSEPEVTGLLLDAAQGVGQAYGEACRTIASGLRRGAQRPRTVAA